MRSKIKLKRYQFAFTAILIFSSIIITFQGGFNLVGGFNQESDVKNNAMNLNTSGYWNITSPIYIDDAGTNNWAWVEGESWFGGGTGTQGNPYIIENITIDVNNNFDFCISIQNSNKYFIIRNCTVSEANLAGIFLENVNYSKIMFNKVLNNDNIGIGLVDSYRNVILGNNANYNFLAGIGLNRSNFNSILNNTAKYNANYGIGLAQSKDNLISGNIASNHLVDGIALYYCTNTTISNNTAQYNTNYGISIAECETIFIMNNTLNMNNNNGMLIWASDYNIITGNYAYQNVDGGIDLGESNYNTVSGNIANNNGIYGIYLESSNHNEITGNSANSNPNSGIFLFHSNYNTVSGNTAYYNIDTGIAIMNSEYNVVIGNTASNTGDTGIRLDFSDNNIISENTISNNAHGLNLYIINNNQFIENDIINNNVGIYICESSKCNTFSNNYFSGNDEDIQGTQESCLNDDLLPIIIGIIGIISVVIIAGALMIKKRKSTVEVRRFKKHTKKEETKNAFVEKREEPSKLETLESEKRKEVLKADKEAVLPSLKENVSIVESTEEKITVESQIETSAPAQIQTKEEKIIEDIIEAPEGEIIKCPFCEKELSSDYIFCLRCGKKIKK